MDLSDLRILSVEPVVAVYLLGLKAKSVGETDRIRCSNTSVYTSLQKCLQFTRISTSIRRFPAAPSPSWAPHRASG